MGVVVAKVSKQAAALGGAFGALSGLPDKTQDPPVSCEFWINNK